MVLLPKHSDIHPSLDNATQQQCNVQLDGSESNKKDFHKGVYDTQVTIISKKSISQNAIALSLTHTTRCFHQVLAYITTPVLPFCVISL